MDMENYLNQLLEYGQELFVAKCFAEGEHKVVLVSSSDPNRAAIRINEHFGDEGLDVVLSDEPFLSVTDWIE